MTRSAPAAASAAARQSAAYWSLGVTCVTLALAYGVWYAYSVFLVALINEFGWSRSVLAGAFSVFTLVTGAVNPVVGDLGDRLGPRRVIMAGSVILALALWAVSLITTPWQLYAAFGVATAAGVAAAGWTPAVILVQRQFTDRLGLALGIAGSGIGLGIFLVVPLCQVLIDAYGWRWAFRILAVVCVGWILPVTWLVVGDAAPGAAPRGGGAADAAEPPRRTAPAHPAGTAYDLSLAAAMATLPFWLIAAAKFFGNLCSQMLHVHQAAFFVDHGVTAMVAASIIGVVGAASIIGKIGGGWLSDFLSREVVYALGMATMVASVGLLGLVSVTSSVWIAYGYAVLFGIGYSVTASLIPAMVSDRFRGRHFGVIFGVAQMGAAIGSALGAWLAGRIFDATGSYGVPFALAAMAAVIAAIAMWIARTVRLSDGVARRAGGRGRIGAGPRDAP
jgi:MFS family permease